MILGEQEIKILKSGSYVAQQIQTGQKPTEAHLEYLCRIYQSNNAQADLLKALLKSLDVPQLERLLCRRRPGNIPDDVPLVPGEEVTLYKTTLPGEVQARVATDSLIARYLSWLARNPFRRAVALVESDRHVIFFIPEGSKFDPEETWDEFIHFVFSIEELVRTFVVMLNTIHLSERETGGFQVPNFPVVSPGSRLVIMAWLLRGLEQKHDELQRNPEKLKDWNEEIRGKIEAYLENQTKIYHEISQLREQLKRESNPKHRNGLENKIRGKSYGLDLSLAQMDHCKTLFQEADGDPFKFLKLYQDAHPELFQQVKKLSELFTRKAVQQIGWRKNRMAEAIIEIVRLVSWSELYQQGKKTDFVGAVRARPFRVKPLLLEAQEAIDPRLPGDNTDRSGFCYVCGRLLSAEDEAEINRLISESPSQRLQSSGGEKRPAVCYNCVAIALASPLKPSKQSTIIRLEPVAQNGLVQGRSAAVLGKLESFLRGLTLSQLDLAAGNYLMLTSSERVKVGGKWRYFADVVGTKIYTHLRLAELFDHQVFMEYKAFMAMGLSDLQLESYRLAFLSVLIKALQLNLTEGSEINRSLASATRYVLADEPILAIYELVSQPDIDQRCRQEKVRMEIEKSLEVWTHMIGENRAKVITDVVAMAGLLYPFVDQTRREVGRKKESDPGLDPDREASKLIEEVEEVFNFLYRFADHTTYSTARLYRNPTNWFTYEQTKTLLEKLGIPVNEREKIENDSRFLEITTNDVEAAYKKFAEEDYKADADWRAFTYRLKLALYSRFPGLGVKKEGTA
jgi:hypothetical protein